MGRGFAPAKTGDMAVVVTAAPPRGIAAPPSQRRPPGPRRPVALRAALSAALAAAILGIGLPKLAGAPWADVGAAMSRVSPLELLALGTLWVVGLGVHTISLAAA